MVRILERAVLRASPDRVWEVLTDWEGQAGWMPDVAWIRLLGEERGLGARLAVRTKVFGLPATTDRIEVTGFEPGKRLAVDHLGLVRGWGEWRLEPRDGGAATAFEWEERLQLRVPVVGGLALLAYLPVQRAMLRRSVGNLRGLVEG
ncbi:MAG: SRPBCC family protein [Actinobacteria bacterium]|nr:SRPBCC family protein [Actinomycetota bacterium]